MKSQTKSSKVKRVSTSGKTVEVLAQPEQRFTRVTAFVVALENYRKPSKGEPLPSVDFAHADGDAFAETIQSIYADLPEGAVAVHLLKDHDASLAALRDELTYIIKTLPEDELFIFYYAGHGFHGAGSNRLSTYDTNRAKIEDTSLSMRDDLLEPLMDSSCRQALVFVDACAEKFSDFVKSRDVITNLDADEAKAFLNSGWYLGVFLSCSPGEKSYPSNTLKHGIWTHFLLEALEGRAPEALTQDRWLTDFGLRDYLSRAVPPYITRELNVRGSQTPQAILTGTSSFQVRHIPNLPVAPNDTIFADVVLRNNCEFLEDIETGAIRNLPGFKRGFHTEPTEISDSAEAWCARLLDEQVQEELQEFYEASRTTLGVRRKEVRKANETGAGDLDTPAFRYSIETGQDYEDPSKYTIQRRLELRQGWQKFRVEIEDIFSFKFNRLVIELERLNYSFDDLVDKLEDIQEHQGGDVKDDDRTERASYKRDGEMFVFDLKKRRLEISIKQCGMLELVDKVQKFQLGNTRSSPMLAGA